MKKCEIIMRRAMISLLMCVSVSLSPVYGQQAVVPSPFLSAAVFDGQRAALVLAPQNVNEAVQIIRRIIDLSPDTASSHYLLASLLARQKKMDAAFDRLTIAVRKGFRDLKLLNSDPSFVVLRKQERFKSIFDLIADAGKMTSEQVKKEIVPARITNGKAFVGSRNTLWDPSLKILKSYFIFDGTMTKERKIGEKETVRKTLSDWRAGGMAAGNKGDLYDNHDRGHSRLSVDNYAGLSAVIYDAEAQKIGVDYGFNECPSSYKLEQSTV